MKTKSQHQKGHRRAEKRPLRSFRRQRTRSQHRKRFLTNRRSANFPTCLTQVVELTSEGREAYIRYLPKDHLGTRFMSDLKLTPSLLAMLERIERHSGSLLMLAVTASGGQDDGKLNKLRGGGYGV